MKTVKDYNFNTDIKDGEKGESIISNFLQSYGYKQLSDNKDNKYDLKMLTDKGIETTFEVKTDVFCYPERIITENGVEKTIPRKDTGNMFIEMESRGKASGISVTQANWFVMYFPYFKKAWFIRVTDLKQLIEENDFRIVTGGDPGSNTKGYLINRRNFQQYFKVQTIKEEWAN